VTAGVKMENIFTDEVEMTALHLIVHPPRNECIAEKCAVYESRKVTNVLLGTFLSSGEARCPEPWSISAAEDAGGQGLVAPRHSCRNAHSPHPDRPGVSGMERNKAVPCHPVGSKAQCFRCKPCLLQGVSLCVE